MKAAPDGVNGHMQPLFTELAKLFKIVFNSLVFNCCLKGISCIITIKKSNDMDTEY